MKERITQFAEDKSGVSPVIGVILMVAITVILAAVIGTFVLGLGQQVGQTAPSASIGVQDASNTYDASTNDSAAFVLNHNNGDALSLSDIRVQVKETDGSTVAQFESGTWNQSGLGLKMNGGYLNNSLPDPAEFGIGDSMSIVVADNGTVTGDLSAGNDYTVAIVHVPSESTPVSQTVELN